MFLGSSLQQHYNNIVECQQSLTCALVIRPILDAVVGPWEASLVNDTQGVVNRGSGCDTPIGCSDRASRQDRTAVPRKQLGVVDRRFQTVRCIFG
jgi:hypothetical protein